MKEKLSASLGVVGVAVWYIVSFLYSFAPLLFLHFGILIDFILIAVMTTLPIVGEIVRVVLYVWAFAVVISQPIDVFSVIFFVCAGLYALTTFAPFVASLFSKK